MTGIGSTTPSPRPPGCAVSAGRPSRCPVWRFGAYPYQAGDAGIPRRWNAPCTTGTGTSSSRRPAPARRSSPRWTTGVCASQDSTTDRHCCSSRTARRSSSQSLRTYREVLGDASFGELYVGGSRPERWQHVFASVQSLHSYGVDEPPGRRLRDRRHRRVPPRRGRDLPGAPRSPRPARALGLTATPERADGVDVRSFFGGRTAAELRLWDALER